MLPPLAGCCKSAIKRCKPRHRETTSDPLHDEGPPTNITKEYVMPFVNVKVIKGVFSTEQKKDMIGKLTDTMVGIEGETMRQVTWVTIEEVDSGDWGIGGHSLTTQDVKDLQAGRTK
jgi:4-oxalocrotonate tautomerase